MLKTALDYLAPKMDKCLPESIRCLDRVLKNLCRKVIVEVVKGQAEEPHDLLAFDIRDIFEECLC